MRIVTILITSPTLVGKEINVVNVGTWGFRRIYWSVGKSPFPPLRWWRERSQWL